MDRTDRFAKLFAGRTDARGADDGYCIHEQVTRDTYRAHLAGRQSLGIYPLGDDATCQWIAADIDTATRGKGTEETHRAAVMVAHALRAELAKLGITEGVWLERSKSRGVHVWLFFDRPVLAYTARRLMMAAARAAGVKVELFPKQDQIGAGNRLGNYIHLPYLGGGKETPTRRVMLDWESTDPLPLDAFLVAAEAQLIAGDRLLLNLETTPPAPKSTRTTFGRVTKDSSGPTPCFNRMLQLGAPEGARNDTATALAMHLNRQGEGQSAAESILLSWNSRNTPPLSEGEIRRTVASVYGRGYRSLWCEHPAVAPHCAPTCPVYKGAQTARRVDEVETQEEEVKEGADATVLTVADLRIITQEPTTYRLQVNGSQLSRLTTDDLVNWGRFCKRCIEQLQILPSPPVKASKVPAWWEETIRPLIEHCVVEEIPEETTASGRMEATVRSWVADNRAKYTEDRTDIPRGRIWITAQFAWFDFIHFAEHLAERGYDRETLGAPAWRAIRALGGESKVVRINGRPQRVVRLPLPDGVKETDDKPEETSDGDQAAAH